MLNTITYFPVLLVFKYCTSSIFTFRYSKLNYDTCFSLKSPKLYDSIRIESRKINFKSSLMHSTFELVHCLAIPVFFY